MHRVSLMDYAQPIDMGRIPVVYKSEVESDI